MIATWITRQLVVDGALTGLLYALLATGVVLIYRATRVINFAVGGMGLVGAGLLSLLVVEWNVPYWIAVALVLLAGTTYGLVIELGVIRRLFQAPRVIVLVATVGIAQLSMLIVIAFPDFTDKSALFPRAIGSTFEDVLGLGFRLSGPQVSTLIVVPLITGLLAWYLTRTTLGKTVKASASNRDLARLVGINPKLVSSFVWAVGGVLATIAMCLIAAQTNARVGSLTLLGSNTLIRALVAAVVAKMVSFPRAFVAGIAIGVVESVIRFNFLDQGGLVDFLLLLVVLVAVFFQSRGHADAEPFSFAPRVKPVPERLRGRWWVRQVDRVGLWVFGLGALVLPIVVTQPSRHLTYGLIAAWAIAAVSLTVLTGWAGQLSLGQMAFAGIGALLAAGFQRGLEWDIRFGDLRINTAGLEPLPWELAVLLASLATTLLAVVIGAGALRVRGLLLAVSTYVFAHAAVQYLYRRPLLTGNQRERVLFERTDVFGIDITSQRAIYYVCLVVLGVLLFVVGRLRRSPVGWSTIAVRDNPDTAAAYSIDPTMVKLRTFALAGAIAGLGGALLASVTQGLPLPVERYFTLDDSLTLLAIVVIGGLGATSGSVIGAAWVIGLPFFFPGNQLAPLLTSSVGLLLLLLYVPGGFAQLGYASRDALLAWVERRLPPALPQQRHSVPPSLKVERAAPATDGPVLATTDVVVTFGGNRAVDRVSIEVRRGEIVGLIGTNGAGKSTLMNAIGGFVPAHGRIELLGRDVSTLSPAHRSRRGLGRTFQAATLFPELTVRETVQVALEARGRSGLIATAVGWPSTVARQRRHRAAAADLIDVLGLGRYADSYIADLSTGTRRIVELAGLLALQAELLCLDEPTAGVAQKETEAFGPLIVEIRKELGASMLVIEHDMPLIMGISDRVYCLEAGRVIAEGDPRSIRNDPLVIASYLGTDERAIDRSGSVATAAEADR
ncbi:MAG: ABC transporter permease subunit [Actinomycetes bacterium]